MHDSPVAKLAVVALLVMMSGGQLFSSDDVTGTLVVLNKAEATASLIDLSSGEVVATLPTGEGPHEVAVSPEGHLAVAGNYGTRESAGNSLTVLNIRTARVVRTIDLGDYHKPHGLAWLDKRRLVVTVESSKAVLIVDVLSGEILGKVETGQEISHMLVTSPDGRRAFVANIGSGSITVIDLETQEHIADIVTGEGAEGIEITPDGDHVWVTNRAADTISVIDTTTLEIVRTVKCKSFPIRAKVTPDGRTMLVSNARSGDLAVFDTKKMKEKRRIRLKLEASETEGRLFGSRFGDSSVPIGVVIHPGGKYAYVAHANADAISVLDLEKWEKVGQLTAGKEPDGMAYSPVKVRQLLPIEVD